MGPNFLRHMPMQNEILQELPHAELEAIRPHLRRTRLVLGQVLVEQGQEIEQVYFIEDGVASHTAEQPNTRSGVQVAMVGKEGFIGGQALLDAGAATLTSAVVHIPGSALRLAVRDFHSLLAENDVFRRLCLAALAVQMQQIMQTSASNARDTVAVRCVRWLLMTQQRVGNELAVTHEALSAMLGVRRSGVTGVLTALQGERLVSVQRGRIVILDREGLERMAGPSSPAAAAAWGDAPAGATPA